MGGFDSLQPINDFNFSCGLFLIASFSLHVDEIVTVREIEDLIDFGVTYSLIFLSLRWVLVWLLCLFVLIIVLMCVLSLIHHVPWSAIVCSLGTVHSVDERVTDERVEMMVYIINRVCPRNDPFQW
ncbi:hypothetical protein Droror1_Dr00022805 [Drosera rotundifolia]